MTKKNGAAGCDGTQKDADQNTNPSLLPIAPTAQAAPLLLIERVITNDAGGQCWPPTTLMNGWHRIRSLPNGRTAWRRISISDPL